MNIFFENSVSKIRKNAFSYSYFLEFRNLKKHFAQSGLSFQFRLAVARTVTNTFSVMHYQCTGISKNLKTGDVTNIEGIAAQHYWKYLINPDFLRGRFGDSPNQFFNFGYAVLRSIIARAIVESGLLPVLGIFHRNKYNAYCLADDLMEPYRPMVDLLVMQLLTRNPEAEELTK